MLNVVYCCDDVYAPYVGISMLSCIENNFKDFNKIVFHIIEDHISDSKKEKLGEIIERYDNCSIKFYPFDYKVDVPDDSRYPSIVYSPLFIPNLIDVDKCLYLDSDTIVLGSFKELFSIELNDNYLGAVLDLPVPNFKTRIGFSNEDNYYNSGVLLMDLNKLRNDNFQEKLITSINKQVKYPDQDIINIVLKGNIYTLHPKYNCFGYFLELDYDTILKLFSFDGIFYSKSEMDDAKQNMVCTHFINIFVNKPWNDDANPIFPKFKEYALKSPFDDEEVFTQIKMPFWKILIQKILRNIPSYIYMPFVKRYLYKIYKR